MNIMTESELFPSIIMTDIEKCRKQGRMGIISSSVMNSFERQIVVLRTTASEIESEGGELYSVRTGRFTNRFKFAELICFFYLYLDSIAE